MQFPELKKCDYDCPFIHYGERKPEPAGGHREFCELIRSDTEITDKEPDGFPSSCPLRQLAAASMPED